jgi:hypothetical protein
MLSIIAPGAILAHSAFFWAFSLSASISPTDLLDNIQACNTPACERFSSKLVRTHSLQALGVKMHNL